VVRESHTRIAAMSEYIAQEIVCCNCGAEFIWTAGQQAFYQGRNLSKPKRCRDCAQARKRELETASAWSTRTPWVKK
jgi:hypothetical protein